MTQDAQTLDGVIMALVFAVFGALATIGIPALFKWFSGKLDNAVAREKKELAEDETQEKLDQETRQLTNRLAMKAFDREEELSRLKSEYREQGELLTLTRKDLADCRQSLAGCQDVQVEEYRRHERALLDQLELYEARIKRLEKDVAILEATR